MADQLPMQERSDAHYMLAWMSAALGDLPSVITAAESWLGQMQPGQGPGFGIGLAAWRTYAIWQLGRWDEVGASFESMRMLWVEANRMAAAFALHGVYTTMEVARSRDDAPLLDRAREMFDDMLSRFDPKHPTRALAALGSADPALVAGTVLDRPGRFLNRPVHIEYALALCSDRGHRISVDILQPILDVAPHTGLRPLEAQARRALGLTRDDPSELELALGLFEAMGSIPFAARTRTELGFISGDVELLDRGAAELEALGDRDQLARVNARRQGRG
jgi:hypothetical protein